MTLRNHLSLSARLKASPPQSEFHVSFFLRKCDLHSRNFDPLLFIKIASNRLRNPQVFYFQNPGEKQDKKLHENSLHSSINHKFNPSTLIFQFAIEPKLNHIKGFSCPERLLFLEKRIIGYQNFLWLLSVAIVFNTPEAICRFIANFIVRENLFLSYQAENVIVGFSFIFILTKNMLKNHFCVVPHQK